MMRGYIRSLVRTSKLVEFELVSGSFLALYEAVRKDELPFGFGALCQLTLRGDSGMRNCLTHAVAFPDAPSVKGLRLAVALIGGNPVAWALRAILPRPMRRYELMCFTKPAYRRHGIASVLVQSLTVRTVARIKSSPFNKAGRGFFTSLGIET